MKFLTAERESALQQRKLELQQALQKKLQQGSEWISGLFTEEQKAQISQMTHNVPHDRESAQKAMQLVLDRRPEIMRKTFKMTGAFLVSSAYFGITAKTTDAAAKFANAISEMSLSAQKSVDYYAEHAMTISFATSVLVCATYAPDLVSKAKQIDWQEAKQQAMNKAAVWIPMFRKQQEASPGKTEEEQDDSLQVINSEDVPTPNGTIRKRLTTKD